MIALHVRFNGTIEKTAVLGDGAIIATANCSRIAQDGRPPESATDWSASFSLTGVNLMTNDMCHWLMSPLKEGDVITLSLVEADTGDSSAWVRTANEATADTDSAGDGPMEGQATDIAAFLTGVIKTALLELADEPVHVFTFAFYHDHESNAISVCIDTMESSERSIRAGNHWANPRFRDHVLKGDWDQARSFQSEHGRSLSLGDFARVNLARTDIPDEIVTDETFHLEMVRAVIRNEDAILRFAQTPEDVLFCCSSVDSEVGMVWSSLPQS